MSYYLAKVVISSILIVIISETAKVNLLLGALLTSLPILSILAFIWTFVDTGDAQKISHLSQQVFWLVIPSLIFFLTLPSLLKQGANFYLSMFVSMALTAIGYGVMVVVLKKFGIEL